MAAERSGQISAEIAGWLADHAAESEGSPAAHGAELRVGDTWVMRQCRLGRAVGGAPTGEFDAALAFAVVGTGMGREALQRAVRTAPLP